MGFYYELPDAPLMYGDKGMQVDRLQWCLDHALKLTKRKRTAYKEAGRYDHYTETRVAEFQTKQGIKCSGVFDHWTRARLREALENADKSME